MPVSLFSSVLCFVFFCPPHIELQPIPRPWTALLCLRMELTSSHFQAGARCVVGTLAELSPEVQRQEGKQNK